MTKRQLGYLLILGGVSAIVALFGVDLLEASQFQGVGPAQRLALLVAGSVVLIGVSLLPLGDRAA